MSGNTFLPLPFLASPLLLFFLLLAQAFLTPSHTRNRFWCFCVVRHEIIIGVPRLLLYSPLSLPSDLPPASTADTLYSKLLVFRAILFLLQLSPLFSLLLPSFILRYRHLILWKPRVSLHSPPFPASLSFFPLPLYLRFSFIPMSPLFLLFQTFLYPFLIPVFPFPLLTDPSFFISYSIISSLLSSSRPLRFYLLFQHLFRFLLQTFLHPSPIPVFPFPPSRRCYFISLYSRI